MANEKILVVDDDKNICELLRLYLVKEGYNVTMVHDGGAALAEFDKLHPDLVLLDVMMPVMDDPAPAGRADSGRGHAAPAHPAPPPDAQHHAGR